MSASSYTTGQAVGPYSLTRNLEVGANDESWLAQRGSDGACVTLVVLAPGAARDPAMRGWLQPLAAAGSKLQHANILQLVEAEPSAAGWIAYEGFDAMDLLQLEPALEALARRDANAWLAAVGHLVEQAALALAHAHARGIVHRTLGPASILVAPSGAVKLRGFGTADRPTESTSPVHSPDVLRYLAPEQLTIASRAPAVDVFALGAILHELLDGRQFRDGHGDAQSLYRAALSGSTAPLVRPVATPIDALRVAMLSAFASRPVNGEAVCAAMGTWQGRTHGRAVLAAVVQEHFVATGRAIDATPVVPAIAPRLAPAPLPLAMPVHAGILPPAVGAPSPMPMAAPPAFVPPIAAPPMARMPLPPDEGTVELDEAILAAMRAGTAPPVAAPQPMAAPRELVMAPPAARSSSRSAPPPAQRASPQPPAFVPAPAPVAAPRSMPPVAADPPRVRENHGPLELHPTYEPTTTTTLRARNSSRNFTIILVVAALVAIAVGVGVGYVIVGDDPGATPTKAAPRAAEPPSKGVAPPPGDGPTLQPRAP